MGVGLLWMTFVRVEVAWVRVERLARLREWKKVHFQNH